MWTGLADVWAGDSEIFPFVVDLPYSIWHGVDAFFPIQYYGVVAPGGFEELVHYFHVLFGLGVAVVVLGLFVW